MKRRNWCVKRRKHYGKEEKAVVAYLGSLILWWEFFQNKTQRPYLRYNRYLLSQHLLIGG